MGTLYLNGVPSTYLPLSGGTDGIMTGNLLATDDTYYLGDSTHGWKGLHMPATLIRDETGQVDFRNNADSAWVGLGCSDITPTGNLYFQADAAIIRARNLDSYTLVGEARDNGVGPVEIWRMVGAADPYFHIGYGSGATTYGVGIRTITVTKAHTADLFDAVGLTDSVVIWAQPAGSVLLSIKVQMTAQFAAAGMTDLDVTIGDAGDNDGLFVAAMNLTSDAANTTYKGRGAYWDTSAEGVFWYANAATNWTAYATAVGANLDTTSAGSISFYFTYLDIP